jgi:hypothetical protein
VIKARRPASTYPLTVLNFLKGNLFMNSHSGECEKNLSAN